MRIEGPYKCKECKKTYLKEGWARKHANKFKHHWWIVYSQLITNGKKEIKEDRS